VGVSSIPNNSGIGRGTTAQRPSAPPVGTPYFNGTTGELQIYSVSGWAAVNAVPFPVTGVSFTNTGAANAWSATAGTANITFTPATGGGVVSSYIVTPTPTTSPGTFSSTSSPVAVTGLAPGTSYSFSVVGQNNYGTSAGVPTSGTPTTKPAVPVLTTPTFSSTTLSLPFTIAANGGSAITAVTPSSSIALTSSGTASPLSITASWVSGTTYNFTATATNANGTTAASNSVSATYYSVATIGYLAGGDNNMSGNNGTSSISKFTISSETFSSIGATLSETTARGASVGSKIPGGAGYVMGGIFVSATPAIRSSIKKLNYTNEATSVLGATTTSSQGAAGLSSYAAGYQLGGANTATGGVAASANVTSITKLTFSNETTSTPGATVNSRWGGGAAVNGGTSTVGYIMGGYSGQNSGNATYVTNVQKLTFSSDTISTASGSTGNQVANAAAFGNQTNIYHTSYHGGGGSGAAPTGLYKMPISTETWSAVNYATTLGWTNQYGSGGAGAALGTIAINAGETFAYMCGGNSGGYQTYSGGQVNGSILTQPMKLNMSNDTMTLATGADTGWTRIMGHGFSNGI
jgi:hypothetical protein